ncbi:MAG: WecB/TagA/CpsF family glycosyltransferase [Clostridia bacterium]
MREYLEKTYIDTASSFYKLVRNNFKKEVKTFIVTANPETLMMAEGNLEFKKVLLDKETIIIPDGIGVVKGARMLGFNVKERIPGVELSEELLKYANELNKSIFLFGSKKEVIEKMKELIKTKYPNIKIAGLEDGYVEDKDEVFKRIIEAKPDIILVALGIPNQEMLIYKYLKDFDKGIFVGVGGTFDVLSGVKKRAPKIFISLHLEWLYRLIKEPKRIKRFYESNVKYINIIKKENKK